jgi:hypothetical protein
MKKGSITHFKMAQPKAKPHKLAGENVIYSGEITLTNPPKHKPGGKTVKKTDADANQMEHHHFTKEPEIRGKSNKGYKHQLNLKLGR